MFEENNKKNNNITNNNTNDQRANYIETFGNKNITDNEKTDNALSWLDNNDTKIKDNNAFIDTKKNENNDNNNDDNIYHDSQENININNNVQMEDKEVQVKIPRPKKKLPPIEKKVEEKKIENDNLFDEEIDQKETEPVKEEIINEEIKEEPEIIKEEPKIVNEVKNEDNIKPPTPKQIKQNSNVEKNNIKQINNDNKNNVKNKNIAPKKEEIIELKSCLPEEYYKLPLISKFYYLKKLYINIAKKSNEVKSKNVILQAKYNFDEIFKEMNKVQNELNEINSTKNEQILDENKKLIQEINLIQKRIQIKTKKIKNIQSSDDYINKLIKTNNNSSVANLQNDYNKNLNNLLKTRDEYIKLIKSIEANKEIINKNEEELISMRETKKDLMEINYKYSQMVEENQEQKQKLKKMREKFGTVYGSDEDNKNVYRNAIFELDKEIRNKLGKIDELKIELNKQKANDDKAQEQINNIYNKIKQKQNNILINDDLFKFKNDDTNGNKDKIHKLIKIMSILINKRKIIIKI